MILSSQVREWGSGGQNTDAASTKTSLLVAISIDDHYLLLPQREVFSLESVLDVKREGAQAPSSGTIELAGVEWPVYCLSGAALITTMDFPSQRRICLLLNDGHDYLAIACDQIETLTRQPQGRFPLPPCQAKADALIESLIVDEETVRCMTTTARLKRYCQRNGNRDTDYG